MRPIVPCHSAIQNPAAKFLSWMLKPIVAKQPYVLEGSKALAIALDKIKLPYNKSVYIISGDVTAYYPNVPLEKARRVTTAMLMEHYFPDLLPDQYTDNEVKSVEIFNALYDIANQDLVMIFQNDYYRQKKGLAMGMASSPDIANLYGAYSENILVEQLGDKVLYYCRYIDDVLAFVIADNAEEAMSIGQQIVIEDCEIIWSASARSTVFLDMNIYIVPQLDNRVHYMPYKKAQNNLERIPWVSHHPFDVKRGTFIGEITRMATLSSDYPHYDTAVSDLRDLYVARGYPVHLVKSWLDKYKLGRWQNRLAPVESNPQATGLHVIKTVFNPVWSFIDVHKIQEVILDEWRKEIFPDFNSSKVYTLWDFGVEKVAGPPRRRQRRRKQCNTAGGAFVSETISEDSSDEDELEQQSRGPPKRARPTGLEVTSAEDVGLSLLMNQRMILSRRRRVTTGDLAASWRKTVLGYYDDAVQTFIDLDD